MQVSKVTFFKETKELLNNPVLDQKKKLKLRRERVKDYIRSIPAGSLTSTTNLIAAAGYDPRNSGNYATGWQFVNGMIKRGEILFDKQPRKRLGTASVPGDAKTIVPPKKTERQEPAATPERPLSEQTQGRLDNAVSAISIENLAREYSWTENSDSLRGFITYVKTRV